MFLAGSRRLNTRMGMFARSLLQTGAGVKLASLPRQRWVCRSLEEEYALQDTGHFLARLGRSSLGRLEAVACFHWALLPLGLLIARLRRVPLIYDEHDDYALNTLEGGGSRPLRRLVQKLIGLVHRLCVPHVDLVTCIHQKDSLLLGELSALNSNCLELANYPDERWQCVTAPVDRGPVHFIYAGGVFAEKGVTAAIKAFIRLHAEMPGAACLDIFGDGDPKLARQWAASGNVTFHGEVGAADLRRFAARNRCCGLALLSRTPRYDLAGTNLTKLYEYLALGMPVLVSNSGEVGGFVSAARTGLVIDDPEDIDALAGAMQKLVAGDGLYAGYAAAACGLMARPDMRWEHEWQKVAATGIWDTKNTKAHSGQ